MTNDEFKTRREQSRKRHRAEAFARAMTRSVFDGSRQKTYHTEADRAEMARSMARRSVVPLCVPLNR